MKKARSKWSRVLLTVTLIALTGVCLLIMAMTGVHLWKVFATDSPETIAAIRANFSQELVFSLLGVAISVWIGLNIYNVLSKEDLQVLVEKTEETARRIEETAERVTEDAYTEVVISKLRLMPTDRIENYLASQLSNLKRLPRDILTCMIKLEDKFNYAYSMYVANQYTKAMTQGLCITDEIESMLIYGEGLDIDQTEFLLAYIALRKADLTYFSFQCRHEKCREKAAMVILDRYRRALLKLFKIDDISFHFPPADYEVEQRQGIALLLNNICSTYLVLFPRKLTEGELQKAIEAGKKAEEFAAEVQPHIRAVFLRNLGVAYELNGDWGDAMKCYYRAYCNDPTAPKVLHCIASLYRKELGKIIDRENVSKDEKEKLLEQSTYWYWMELIHRGGAMPKDSWPVDLQKYAEKLHAKKFQEQALRDVLRLGEKCRKELASMAESKS